MEVEAELNKTAPQEGMREEPRGTGHGAGGEGGDGEASSEGRCSHILAEAPLTGKSERGAAGITLQPRRAGTTLQPCRGGDKTLTPRSR